MVVLQRACRQFEVNPSVDVDQLRFTYGRCVSSCKELLRQLKKADREYFVHEHSDDSWGRVYQIFKENKVMILPALR